jgi:hypothetical protein
MFGVSSFEIYLPECYEQYFGFRRNLVGKGCVFNW